MNNYCFYEDYIYIYIYIYIEKTIYWILIFKGDCSQCTQGYYCPSDGTVEPLPCLVGKFSAPGADVCTNCTVGYYCVSNTTSAAQMNTEFICPAGMHCPEGLSYQPYAAVNPCLAGHYCVQGNEVSYLFNFSCFCLAFRFKLCQVTCSKQQ